MDIICRLVIFRGIAIGINDCSDSDHGSNCVKPSTEDAEPKRNSKLSGISSCRSSLLWRNIKTFASFHGTWEMSPVMLMGCFVDSDWVIFFPRDFIFTPVFKCGCGCDHGLISALQKEFRKPDGIAGKRVCAISVPQWVLAFRTVTQTWPQRIYRPIADQDSIPPLFEKFYTVQTIETLKQYLLEVLETRRPGIKIALREIVLKGEEIRVNSTDCYWTTHVSIGVSKLWKA